MKKVLISACLVGDRVRYDGKRVPLTHPLLNKWHQKGMLVKVCPEVSGGLNIPRPPAQIVNGNGLDVLKGRSQVVNIEGQDVTGPFIKGAEYAFTLARENNIDMAILKEKSPSCGVHQIYDGRFDSHLIPGFGITAALLKQNGIRVFSENELDQVNFIQSLKGV